MTRWLRNVGTGYADTLVGGVIFIVLTPLFVRELGIEGYAVWILGHTIVFYLAFLDLGFGNAQVRYHARFVAQGRASDVRATIATSCVSLVFAGVVAGLIGTAIALFTPLSWLHLSRELIDDFRLVVLLLSAEMLVSFAASAVENIYEGANRFDLRNLRSIGLRVLTAAAQVIALSRGAGLVEIVAIELGAACVRLLLDVVLTSRIMPGWWRAPARLHVRVWRRLRSFALWTSADEALTEGGAQLDNLLIAALLPLALLTPYSLCTGVAGLLLMAVEPIVETFFPMASGMHARHRRADLSRLLLLGSKAAMAIAAPLAVFLAFFGHRVLELWVPEAASSVPNGLMPLVVLDYVTSMYLWTATVVIVAIGKTRLAVMLTLAEIALGIVLVLILTPMYGLLGLALASFIANLLLGFCVQIPVVARAVGVSPAELMVSTLVRVGLATLPAVLAAFALQQSTNEPSWSHLFGAATAIFLVYGACFALFGTNRKERALLMVLWTQR